MTAPFAPPPPRPLVLIVIGAIVVVAVMPFARREDWIGRGALLIVAAYSLALWGLLLGGIARALVEWWRGHPPS